MTSPSLPTSDGSSEAPPTSALTPVAIAILYHVPHPVSQAHQALQTTDGSALPRFLMQLRDDIPGIAYPGHWGFFGGHIEAGEHPDDAIVRELEEEIAYVPPAIAKFGTFAGPTSIRHVYAAALTVPIESLALNEGWDMAFLTADEIRQGQGFSSVAKQVRPIGEPHQKLLLAFIDQWIEKQSAASE